MKSINTTRKNGKLKSQKNESTMKIKGKPKLQKNKSKSKMKTLLIAEPVPPTTSLLHEIYIGCCDMTEHINNILTITVNYMADEDAANNCFKILDMKQCTTPCKPSKTGKLCLPDQESLVSTYTKTNEYNTGIDFKFNSKYDGKLIKLIATIPLSANWQIKHICVYEYNNICCICFPSGSISEVRDYKYKNEGEFNIDNLIDDIFKMHNSYDTYLFCGHSMGGSCAQYLCSLNWKDNETYKRKCYLITTGAFKCLTEENNDRLRTHFNNKKWCYCSVIFFGNKYIADNFVGKRADNYVSTDLIMLLTNNDDSVEVFKLDTNTLTESSFEVFKLDTNSDFENNKIQVTFDNKNTAIIEALHAWSGQYRFCLISVLSDIQNNRIDIQNIPTATIAVDNKTSLGTEVPKKSISNYTEKQLIQNIPTATIAVDNKTSLGTKVPKKSISNYTEKQLIQNIPTATIVVDNKTSLGTKVPKNKSTVRRISLMPHKQNL